MPREREEHILEAGPVQMEIDDAGATHGRTVEHPRGEGQVVKAHADDMAVDGARRPLQNPRPTYRVEPARLQRGVRAQLYAKAAAGALDEIGGTPRRRRGRRR